MIRVQFENNGQQMLWLDVEDGRVVNDSMADSVTVWIGASVVGPIEEGGRFAARMLPPIDRVVTLDAPILRIVEIGQLGTRIVA